MPTKGSLKDFLRRDHLSKRTRALVPYYDEYNACRKPKVNIGYEPAANLPFPPRAGTPEEDEPYAHDLSSQPRETDSLFGDTLYTREEILRQKLEKFLAEDQKRNEENEARPRRSDPELAKLMEELNSLVSREFYAHGVERMAIRDQKLALIKAIGKLETMIGIKKVKDCKGRLYIVLCPDSVRL